MPRGPCPRPSHLAGPAGGADPRPQRQGRRRPGPSPAGAGFRGSRSDTRWSGKEGLPKAVTAAGASRPGSGAAKTAGGHSHRGAGARYPYSRPKGSPEPGHLPLCMEGKETRGGGCPPAPAPPRPLVHGVHSERLTREAVMVAKWVPCRLPGTEERHGEGEGGRGRGVTLPAQGCRQVQKFLDTLSRSGNIDQVRTAACSGDQQGAGGGACAPAPPDGLRPPSGVRRERAPRPGPAPCGQRASLARRSRPPGPPRTSKRSRGEQGGSEGRAGGEISGVGTAAGAEGSDPLKFGQGRAFVRLLGRGLRFKPGRGSFRQHWSRVGCVLGLRTRRGPS